MSLRWVYLHMIEEYADDHAGLGDLLVCRSLSGGLVHMVMLAAGSRPGPPLSATRRPAPRTRSGR
jgi:hypothetical protein